MQKYEWKVKSKGKRVRGKAEDVARTILVERGVMTKKAQDDFLNPTYESIFSSLKFPEMDKAVTRIKAAIDKKEKIIIFSDYDADGICAACILWETIKGLGGDVLPYMPNRMTEGYGLATPAVEKLATEGVKLIITVDNGITAVESTKRANELGIDVIITDHHQKPRVMPKPHSLVWSDQICGAGVAFILSKALTGDNTDQTHLEVATLATITDVMPLSGVNRAIVKFGLQELNRTRRVGLLALFHEASLTLGAIDTYEIGHTIGPRLNAMGRLEDAMDSLRLLCTKNPLQAKSLSMLLAKTNSDRQRLTEKMVEDAKLLYEDGMMVGILSHEAWHEGVVGLVAGRMVETFYRPMIAIARGEEFSKGSARSIPGFNIIEALRGLDGVFENIGGHPMAAGFTIRTEKIELLKTQLAKVAKKQLTTDILQRTLNIDLAINLHDIDLNLYHAIQSLAPFGHQNPEPLFLTKNLTVSEIKKVGSTRRHLKLCLEENDADEKEMPTEVEEYFIPQLKFSKPFFEAIGFGMGEHLAKLRPGDHIDVVYNLVLNRWRDTEKLELRVKDLRKSHF